ncbi:hypothetical protein SASPL_123080 [Salvia splendens]|uniref:Uncharacterized protein n=1 Tax=Salvia splendens TaxID=180675 RepID=A0A8X8XQI1_SALSN|nr:hypothetical protein SASPL_123080 [Salvia splendens]
MESRRVPRTVSDPKVRQVGFFAPPDRSHSGPPDPASSPPPLSNISPSGNSLSPVMIPPPRHLPHPQPPLSPLRAPRANETSVLVGSYNPSEFSTPSGIADFSEDQLSPSWGRKSSSGKFATSLPSGGFGMAAAKKNSDANSKPGVADGGADAEVQKEKGAAAGKPLKEKTTKAERRAMQEAQRAAKAATKGKYVVLSSSWNLSS